jgi:hypothetical protein
VSNIYVIRQVRTAYEHQSPLVAASDWEAQGRPELAGGQILYGVVGTQAVPQGDSWTVHYRKWVSESQEDHAPKPVGFEVTDRLTLKKTWKGWKISTLDRQRQPLP